MNNTIFDDVFRTMIEKMPYLAVPLINEVFHTSYPENVPIVQLRNEHQQENGEIITDSCLKIAGKLYHIECQSVDDTTMAIRMIEYAQIFLQNNRTNVYINQYIWYNIYMEKDIFNIDKNKLSYGRGYVYSLQYHLVWCTKYRKKVLKNGIDTECKEMLQNLAEEYKFQILAMEVMPDHIHLLVDCKPQFYISDMIKIMKGNLARQMFLAYPELKKELWGGHLWNPSYCAITVSDRSRDQVLAYIEGQKEKEKKKA